MHTHILLPTDNSELSLKAEEECFDYARAAGAKVTLLHVVPRQSLVIDEALTSEPVRALEKEYQAAAITTAEQALETAINRSAGYGIECSAVVAVANDPYREIIAQATQRRCDMIVMASHGRRGIEGLVIGSETMKVLTHCKIPVLVVR